MRNLIKAVALAAAFSMPVIPAHADQPKQHRCVGDLEYAYAKHYMDFPTKAELEDAWGVEGLGDPAYSSVFDDKVVRYPRCGADYADFPNTFYGAIYWRKRGVHRPLVAIYYVSKARYIG